MKVYCQYAVEHPSVSCTKCVHDKKGCFHFGPHLTENVVYSALRWGATAVTKQWEQSLGANIYRNTRFAIPYHQTANKVLPESPPPRVRDLRRSPNPDLVPIGADPVSAKPKRSSTGSKKSLYVEGTCHLYG